MPIIEVRYGAFSNISFSGTWNIKIDDQDWEEMTPKEREEAINDEAREELLNDVSWEYEI